MTPEEQRAKELEDIPAVDPDTKAWPAGVRELGLFETGHLGIDKDRNLYWDGQRIEVRRALTFWQKVIAGFITAFTLLAALGTCASAYADLCQAGVDLHCPPWNKPAVQLPAKQASR